MVKDIQKLQPVQIQTFLYKQFQALLETPVPPTARGCQNRDGWYHRWKKSNPPRSQEQGLALEPDLPHSTPPAMGQSSCLYLSQTHSCSFCYRDKHHRHSGTCLESFWELWKAASGAKQEQALSQRESEWKSSRTCGRGRGQPWKN